LGLQKLAWSEYHKSVGWLFTQFFVTFISQSFPGSISDKAIVSHSNFLDTVEMYSAVMADKGLNVEKECLSQNIKLYIFYPEKGGSYQMSRDDIKQTKLLAQLQILIIRNI